MITEHDLAAVRRCLGQFKHATTIQQWIDETDYIAFRFGGISRNRAARLIIAARQNKTTADIQRARRRDRRRAR